MTSIELKNEIQKVLDQFPERTLEDILHFLKELQPGADDIKFADDLRRIFEEDKELLEKLAQ